MQVPALHKPSFAAAWGQRLGWERRLSAALPHNRLAHRFRGGRGPRERGGSGGVPTPKPAPHLPETRAPTSPAPSRPPSADTGRPGRPSPPGSRHRAGRTPARSEPGAGPRGCSSGLRTPPCSLRMVQGRPPSPRDGFVWRERKRVLFFGFQTAHSPPFSPAPLHANGTLFKG